MPVLSQNSLTPCKRSPTLADDSYSPLAEVACSTVMPQLQRPHKNLQSLVGSGLSVLGVSLIDSDLVRQELTGELELLHLQAHIPSVAI